MTVAFVLLISLSYFIFIYLFIYLQSDVISQEKKTATFSRSISKASKHAIPSKPTHKTSRVKAYENMGNNHYTGLIFLDLKNAFDSVNHNILLSKLNHYGIRGVAHSLLSSYLTNRKQSVTINNYCSTPLNINNGVPQGSTLGPLLFLIYMNDLENSILTNLRLFADDTCICVNADTISNLEYLINSELLRVNNWLNANKLILNALKSKALIIPPITRQQAPNLKITIDSCQISVVQSVKYLGIYLDNKLTFGPHISYLQSKLSRSIGIISKIKYYVPDRVLFLLYFALFHSHITYGLIIW